MWYFFDLFHKWHLLHEFGLGAGFSAGLILGVEIQQFPFFKFLLALKGVDATWSLSGSNLIVNAYEWIMPVGGNGLPQQISTHYSLNIPLFLVCVIACCLVGYFLAARASKKIAAAKSSAS